VEAAAGAYFGSGAEFGLDWLRDRIEQLDIAGHWQAVARGSLRESLFENQRALTLQVLEGSRERDPARAIERWRKRHEAQAAHARGVITDLRSQPSAADFASLAVALQSVRRLVIAAEGRTR